MVRRAIVGRGAPETAELRWADEGIVPSAPHPPQQRQLASLLAMPAGALAAVAAWSVLTWISNALL